MSEVEDPIENEEARSYPIPPATFEFLVRSLVFQAELNLGMLHFGEEKERPRPDLDMSRHHIDLLEVLQQKTRGNLTIEEQRLVENSLTELRFRYVQAADDLTKAAQAQPEAEGPKTESAGSQQS